MSLFTLVVALGISGLASAGSICPKGCIWLQGPRSAGNSAKIDWLFTFGSDLKPSDKVDLQWWQRGAWKTIARGMPIRKGSFTWNTSKVNPGRVTRQRLRAVVAKTGMTSVVFPIWIDHVPPTAHITRPTPISVNLGGQRVGDAPVAVVAGATRLEASSNDYPFGVKRVDWYISGPVWTDTGYRRHYDFGKVPGLYTIRAIPIDPAGNRGASETIQVLGVPGPTDAGLG